MTWLETHLVEEKQQLLSFLDSLKKDRLCVTIPSDKTWLEYKKEEIERIEEDLKELDDVLDFLNKRNGVLNEKTS